MRLVCPNCASQYEVSDSAIPASGRDVQCASCSHVWFQDAVLMLQPEEMLEVKAPEPTPEPQSEPRSEMRSEPAPTPPTQPDHDLQDLSQNISAEFRSMRGTPTVEDVATAPIETAEPTPVNQAVKDILRSEAEFSTSRFTETADETPSQIEDEIVPDEPAPETIETPAAPRLADILAEEASETVSPLRRVQDAVAKADLSPKPEAEAEVPPPSENVSPLRRIPLDVEEDKTPPAFEISEPEPKIEESKTGAELQLLRQRIFDLEKDADEPATPITEPVQFEDTLAQETADLPDEDLAPEAEAIIEDAIVPLVDDTANDVVDAIKDDEEPIVETFAQAIEADVEQNVTTDEPSEMDDDNILEAGEGLLSVAALRAEREARARESEFTSRPSESEPVNKIASPLSTIEPDDVVEKALQESETPAEDLIAKPEEPSSIRVRKFGEEPPLTAKGTDGDDEQLPDVDELNTSLRMDDKSPLQDIDISEEEPKKRGFYMRGILTAILVFLLFALLFLLAKPLAQMFPVLEPILEIFTGSVDQGLDAAAVTAEKNSGAFGWISNQWEGIVSWLESL